MNNIPTATIATINLNQLKEVPRLEPAFNTTASAVVAAADASTCPDTLDSLSVSVSCFNGSFAFMSPISCQYES
jgi:hypothetical protein